MPKANYGTVNTEEDVEITGEEKISWTPFLRQVNILGYFFSVIE